MIVVVLPVVQEINKVLKKKKKKKYGDISFHSGYVTINLEVSKTDQLRKGNQVVIAESSNDDTCPVKIFKRYLSHLESCPVDRSHYVFRALCKTR